MVMGNAAVLPETAIAWRFVGTRSQRRKGNQAVNIGRSNRRLSTDQYPGCASRVKIAGRGPRVKRLEECHGSASHCIAIHIEQAHDEGPRRFTRSHLHPVAMEFR